MKAANVDCNQLVYR